jgi:selenocysteine-specific translation elongation factor
LKLIEFDLKQKKKKKDFVILNPSNHTRFVINMIDELIQIDIAILTIWKFGKFQSYPLVKVNLKQFR